MNKSAYSHRGFESSEHEEIIKPLFPSQTNESPLDSRLNSQLTTKRSSLVDEFKAFKKSVHHPPSFNTSFEAEELFSRELGLESKLNTGIKQRPRILISPEPEDKEENGEVSSNAFSTKKEVEIFLIFSET